MALAVAVHKQLEAAGAQPELKGLTPQLKEKIVRKVQIDKEVQVKEFDVDSDGNTMGAARATALFSGTPAAEPKLQRQMCMSGATYQVVPKGPVVSSTTDVSTEHPAGAGQAPSSECYPTKAVERAKERVRMRKEKGQEKVVITRKQHVEQHYDDVGEDTTCCVVS